MRTAPLKDAGLLLDDIGKLYVVPPGPHRGAAMRDVTILEDAALLIRDGRIAWFGPAEEKPLDEGLQILSANGRCVIPGLVDPHTHIPFVGDRSDEFCQRIAGELP
jgi:imidazolonepropionase